ncbi:hypothetical protein C7E18_24565, partial [Stenotrophomonas maltophilia]
SCSTKRSAASWPCRPSSRRAARPGRTSGARRPAAQLFDETLSCELALPAEFQAGSAARTHQRCPKAC